MVGSRRDRLQREKRTSAASRAASKVPEVLLVVAATVPPLCLGGRPAWAPALIACIGAVTSAAALWGRERFAFGRAPALVVVAAVTLAWTAAGLVPIPVRALELLTSGSAPPLARESWLITSALLDESAPSWLPWSTSPLDTRQAVVVGAGILSYVLAGAIAVVRGRRRAVLRAVAFSTVATALVVVGHVLVGTSLVYGVFAPRGDVALPSPLFNENHLAGFLALGAPICLGLALSAVDRRNAAGWYAAAALDAVICMAAISRGGTLGLVVGVVVFVVLLAAFRVDEPRRSVRWLGGVALLVFAAGLAAFIWLERIWADFASTTLDKVRIALHGLDLAARSPWVGVGRGGYSIAFVRIAGMDVRYEYPESFPVQWASEWGVPFALILGGTLLALGVRALRRPLEIERASALAALAGLAVHELVDFATEMPGIVVVASLVAVAALGSSDVGTVVTRVGGKASPLLWVPALALVLAGVGITLVGTAKSDRRSRIEEAIGRRDWAAADAAIASALRERPGEPEYVLLGAHARVLRGDRSAIAWLNAVMRLAPHWSSPHLVAARWMAAHGAMSQAWLELREVERRDPGRSVGAACALLTSRASADEALRVMQNETGASAFFEVVVENCHSADTDAVATVDAMLLNGGVPAARVRAARRTLAQHDPTAALALLDGLPRADLATAYVRADALAEAGRPDDAIRALEGLRVSGADRAPYLVRLARAHAAAGDAPRMRETVLLLQGEAAGRAPALAEAMILLGDLEAGLGNREEAYHAYERAEPLDPRSDSLARALALAEREGDVHRASALRARICRRDPAGCPHD